MTQQNKTAELANRVQERESFHEHVIRIVERKLTQRSVCATAKDRTVRLYMAGATDEDVSRWDTRFGSCRRLDTGFIAFAAKERSIV